MMYTDGISEARDKAGAFYPLFRGNRQVDEQGRGDKGGKAGISGNLRRESKMRRKKEVVETQRRQTDREQAGAAPTVETAYDNREVKAGRRGV